MTADELRAKFEAEVKRGWMNNEYPLGVTDLIRDRYGLYLKPSAVYAYRLWQAAYASRDTEVEALRRDVERYRYLRDSGREFVHYTGGGTHGLYENKKLDALVDDAMAEEAAIAAKEQS